MNSTMNSFIIQGENCKQFSLSSKLQFMEMLTTTFNHSPTSIMANHSLITVQTNQSTSILTNTTLVILSDTIIGFQDNILKNYKRFFRPTSHPTSIIS